MAYYKRTYPSPLGKILLWADDEALLGAWFEGQKYQEKGMEGLTPLECSNPILDQAEAWLTAYFAGQKPSPSDLPHKAKGTAFQEKVWQALLAIPSGQTKTYGQLAKEVNCSSAQALGGAVGRNPLSIFIPCHRVLSGKGSLTGYAGGLARKAWLLTHEGSNFKE